MPMYWCRAQAVYNSTTSTAALQGSKVVWGSNVVWGSSTAFDELLSISGEK